MFKKSLLQSAYEKQQEVDVLRLKFNEITRFYEKAKKEFDTLCKQVQDSGMLKDEKYAFSTEVSHKKEINKENFLKVFGQEKFNEAANITITNASAAVGENALKSAKKVLVEKDVFKNIINKL